MKNLQIAKALYEMENVNENFNKLNLETQLKWAYLADVGLKSGLIKIDGNELVKVQVSEIDLKEIFEPQFAERNK